MAEVGIANSLILLSRGVNQAARKRCFVGAGGRREEGKFVADLHIHGYVYVLTRRENIYLGWSLLFLAVTKASNSRLCCFHANKFVTPAALIIAQIELKLSESLSFIPLHWNNRLFCALYNKFCIFFLSLFKSIRKITFF